MSHLHVHEEEREDRHRRGVHDVDEALPGQDPVLPYGQRYRLPRQAQQVVVDQAEPGAEGGVDQEEVVAVPQDQAWGIITIATIRV